MSGISDNERLYCRSIQTKLESLSEHLRCSALDWPVEPRRWLGHMSGVKAALGNLNNDMSFLASLLIKEFLEEEYGSNDFDAAAKPQGAAGYDVEATADDGTKIVGELKTTTPYQMGFGAAQRNMILKDLGRLADSQADHRLMFVVDPDAFDTIANHKSFAHRAPGIKLVDLVTKRSHICCALRD